MYYVYIIRCDDDSLYTGITTDIKRRLNEHYYKKKDAASYTKSRDVISLEALYYAENRSLASKLEYQIKKLSKKHKEELIKSDDDFEDFMRIKHQALATYLDED